MKLKFYLKQLLSFVLLCLPMMSMAQTYGGYVGEYITLPAPTPPSSAYTVTSSTFSTTSKYLDVASGTSSVKILSYFSGYQTVQCDYHCVRQYTVSGKIYEDHQNLTTYYSVYCLSNPQPDPDPNPDPNPDTSIKDGDYFQDYTIEGQLMLFIAGTFYGELGCFVSQTKYGGSCITSANGRVTIPSHPKGIPVRWIQNYAFHNLDGLTELVIPSTTTTVETGVVYGCKNIKNIICEATTPPTCLTSNAHICSTDYNCTLYVPKGCKSLYASANGWKNFKEIKEIGEVEPTGISVSPTSKTIKVGGTFTPTYTLTPSNATTTVTWSSGSGIVSVDKTTGKVTGIKTGTAYVYATTSNGKTASCEVTVEKADGIAIDAVNFPDVNFRNYLLAQDYGKDGILTEEEITKVTSIDVNSKNISSLKGIELFTALASLVCNSNQLTSIDVSNNTALTTLYCNYNQLASLDVSNNTALTDLNCGYNQLTALDVSKNTALATLYCTNNKLTSLDVSKNTALTKLGFYKNQLTSIDVSKNTALTNLICISNQLTSIDVSKNTALTYLACDSNQLTSLDVSKNTALTSLYCNSNKLTSLDVSNNTALTSLFCYKNNIKGKAMDDFISRLPQSTAISKHYIYIYQNTEGDEGNVCTKSQVAAIKAKGWTPLYYNGSQWVEYEGSDDIAPTSISLPVMETVYVNGTLQLTPTIEPDYAVTDLSWSSDDTNIAKVTATGVVVGVKEGTAIITVRTSNGLVAECIVVVKEENVGIDDIEADGNGDVPIYNLAGQRVESLQGKKGIFIVGGKKVLIK